MRAELNRRLLQRWMRAGVTVVDPATTWVDADGAAGAGRRAAPGTQLHGATAVAARSRGRTGHHADRLRGRRRARWWCAPTAPARRSAPDATVGPYAYLRPGTRLGEAGKIGTFVETKNATIGRGSKVPHLTYVGDATIGEYSNIGAAIGVRQLRRCRQAPHGGRLARAHRLGQHVRRAGDGRRRRLHRRPARWSREDVPPGALAVSAGRAAQRSRAGWRNAVRVPRPRRRAARGGRRVRPSRMTAERSEEAYRT